MSAPSKLSNAKWIGVVVVAVILTAVVTTFASMGINGLRDMFVPSPTFNTVGESTEVDRTDFEDTYDNLVVLTEDTDVDYCIELREEEFIDGSLNLGSSMYVDDYDQPDDVEVAIQELLLYCAEHSGYSIYESALSQNPNPTSRSNSYGIPVELPTEEYGWPMPDFDACFSEYDDLNDDIQCVTDLLSQLEEDAPGVIASRNVELRQVWNDRWATPTSSPEVVEALNLLIPILASQPGAAAQERLAIEVCGSKGAWQEAALRIAVEKQAIDFDQKFGIAANKVFEYYFRGTGEYANPGHCSTL